MVNTLGGAYPVSPEFVAMARSLSPDNYLDFIFGFDRSHYAERVDMAGFAGLGRVLDAGCGYGQWAVELARVNSSVTALDSSAAMLDITGRLCAEQGVGNVETVRAELPQLPFPDASFDAVWCWGVLMFVPAGLALAECHRVLRPGGLLFTGCCNAPGRWLYKGITALKSDGISSPMLKAAVKALIGSTENSVPHVLSRRRIDRLCRRAGFRLLAIDVDGGIDRTGRQRRNPMFDATYLGLDNNLEFLCRKESAGVA